MPIDNKPVLESVPIIQAADFDPGSRSVENRQARRFAMVWARMMMRISVGTGKMGGIGRVAGVSLSIIFVHVVGIIDQIVKHNVVNDIYP